MAKWKCEICGNEFDNFHAQGFDNKIYCPLCYFKKENQELQQENKQLKEVIDKLEKYIEKETRIYGLSMSIELGTHFDNILDILKRGGIND